MMKPIDTMSMTQVRIDILRRAIQNNWVTFPAQAPVFEQARADIQWRLVVLYFIRGWTCKQLSRRYDLTRQRIEQIIGDWVHSAVVLGYLQEIPASVPVSEGTLSLFPSSEAGQTFTMSVGAGCMPGELCVSAPLQGAQGAPRRLGSLAYK